MDYAEDVDVHHRHCVGRLCVDPKSARPFFFRAMSHTEGKQNSSQKNEANVQTPLTSFKQHTGLELDRQQSRGRVRRQPGLLVPRAELKGLICDKLREEWWRHSVWETKNKQ